MERVRHLQTTAPWANLPRILVCGHARESDPNTYIRSGCWHLERRSAVIQLTLAGWGLVEDATGIQRVEPGQAFVMHLPDRHVRWRLAAECRAGWEFLWLRFSGGSSEALVDELVARNGRIQTIDPASPLVVRWQKLIDEPASAIAAPEGASLVWGLLTTCTTVSRVIAPKIQQGADLAQRALKLIHRSPIVPPDVRSLAAQLHVTREHLSRVLTHHLGRAPRDILAEERLRRALVLLETTDQPNRAIATAIGLPSAAQLVRLLRRGTGLSPAEFRRSDRTSKKLP